LWCVVCPAALKIGNVFLESACSMSELYRYYLMQILPENLLEKLGRVTSCKERVCTTSGEQPPHD
jgi:hypothetical protein